MPNEERPGRRRPMDRRMVVGDIDYEKRQTVPDARGSPVERCRQKRPPRVRLVPGIETSADR